MAVPCSPPPPRLTTHTLLLLGVLVIVLPVTQAGVGCGDYIQLDSSLDTGQICSPNHPAHYHNFSHCIWLLEAPSRYSIQLHIPSLQARPANSSAECGDFLEVRDGNAQETVKFRGCSTLDTYVVSRNQWMWIRFKADWTGTNTGFIATYTAIRTDQPGEPSPVPKCQNFRFQCRNKQCLSRSYRCDGENDCGCVGENCDEHSCGGINWTQSTKIYVGVAVGTVFFLALFLGLGCLDVYMKQKTEESNKRKEEEILRNAKRRNKRRRNTADTVVQETQDGVKIDVPSPGAPPPAMLTKRATTITSFFKEHMN